MHSYIEKSLIKQLALLFYYIIYLLYTLLRALLYNRISKLYALYYMLELLSFIYSLLFVFSLLSFFIINNLYNKLLRTIYISKTVLRIEVDIDFFYNYLYTNSF